MTPKVSIIIPNYNYARFLPKRMESILNQTYKDYEIVFLDDASNDNSMTIIKQYENRIDKIIVNGKNTGSPFAQWKNGAKNASGEYIWIAEADDFCKSNFLENIIPILEKNKNVGIAYCQTAPIDSENKIITSYTYIQYTDFLDKQKWLKEYINNGKHEVENYMAVLSTIINVSSIVFRKKAFLEAVNLSKPKLVQAKDWLIYIKILEKYDISYTPQILNYHRIHPKKFTNQTVTNIACFKDVLKVFDYLYKNFNLSRQIKSIQFNQILNLWNGHYDGPNGKISKKNNLILFLKLVKFYPHKFPMLFAMYLKTLTPRK